MTSKRFGTASPVPAGGFFARRRAQAVVPSLAAVVALLLGADAHPHARRSPLVRSALGTFTVPALAVAPVQRPAAAPRAPLRLPARIQLAIEREVDRAIERGDMPGAVVVIGRRDGITFRRAFGLASVEPSARPMHEDSVFDLASVTKAVATATSVAALVEEGRVRYDDPVARYVPSFAADDKRGITLRHLLTHTAGLPPVNELAAAERGLPSLLASIGALRLASAPGERYGYSDLGFIVLGEVVARASGEPLDGFARRRLFEPLGLASTAFRPGPGPRLVPTERVGDAFLTGRVHDPRARALGGVAGHAGLFASADDLARFSRMLLGNGSLDGTRVLRPETVREMTRPADVPGARVTLGWDAPDDPGRAAFSEKSFGHEGFTGTSLWIDPERDQFVVFLSSRLHPDGKGRVAPTAQAIRALVGARHEEEAGARIQLGIDRLADEDFARLRGHKVALLSHSAARDRHGQRSIDRLFQALGADLVRVLAPEHGVSADLEGFVHETRDARTGLAVVSLYAEKPVEDAAFSGVDTVVVDLVDAGARFYTYLALLRSVLESGRRVVVLDRPNLGDALHPDGPVSTGTQRFVDPHPLPVLHGMTFGELARLIAFERGLANSPDVVELVGYTRELSFDETGLPWFDPSPNLRSPAAALLYPGVALLEQTNLSVGRGTATPFELVAAPWLDAPRVIAMLGQLAGLEASAAEVVPDRGPYAGERCAAIRFRVTNRRAVRPVELGLALAHALESVHPGEWQPAGMAALLAHSATLDAIRAGAPVPALRKRFESELAAFAARRQRWLLYPSAAASEGSKIAGR